MKRREFLKTSGLAALSAAVFGTEKPATYLLPEELKEKVEAGTDTWEDYKDVSLADMDPEFFGDYDTSPSMNCTMSSSLFSSRGRLRRRSDI